MNVIIPDLTLKIGSLVMFLDSYELKGEDEIQ